VRPVEPGARPEEPAEWPAPTERLGERLLVDAPGVRVWADLLAPGEQQPLHVHRNRYLSVVVAGADGEVLDADGALLYRMVRRPGDVRLVDRVPTTHRLRNTGSGPMNLVIVELLDG
jgi:hypothetical protein